MLLSFVILCRVVANPFSNVFQKVVTRQNAHPLFVILVTHALLAALCFPFVLVRAHEISENLPRSFWLNISAVAVPTVVGNALLVQAVKLSDLSVLGPVNAYKSVISLIPGMLLLGEFPGLFGVAGIAMIVAGSYFVVDKKVTQPRRNVLVRFFTERGIQYRFAAMAVSAVEAVFLKKALLASSPLVTFASWAILGFAGGALATAAFIGRDLQSQRQIATANSLTFASLALSTGLMQLCTIIVLGGFQVGYALALFQTSTLLTVFLGYKVFKEENILERLTGSVVMVAGAVIIVLGK